MHLLASVSLFDLTDRFFVPIRDTLTSARVGAVKVGRSHRPCSRQLVCQAIP